MASFGRNILGNLPEAIKLEWLVTNGIGGFASSTIVGMNTRRYHGILIASRRPPIERILLVSRLEETLICEGVEYPLSTNRYLKALQPVGYLFLERFESEPTPTWTFQINDIFLTKSLFMVHGHNTTIVTYKLFSPNRNVELVIRPHFLFRDFHGNTHENPGFEENTVIEGRSFYLQPFANAPRAYFGWDQGTFSIDNHWYRENYLGEEDRRGLDPIEDDYSNGSLRISDFSGCVSVICSDAPITSLNALDLRKREERRCKAIANAIKSEDPFLQKLLLAADQFIVERASTQGKSIIAGYPWFSDWGRDSLISLPGLTLVSGRFEDARSILSSFAKNIKDGLIPNCFADQGNEALYNSVDASLWFFYAVYKYIEYTDDYSFVKKALFEPMRSIIEAYQTGTRFNIHMDQDDGLIFGGERGIQLTWMDAKVGEWVVTPREGKPVEINALWFNAIKIFELIGEKFGCDVHELALLARKVKTSFKNTFWNSHIQCLYDTIQPDGTPDDSLRANQIFAVFLPFPILEPFQEKGIVQSLFKNLYTSMGLRSLAPEDPHYVRKYSGGRAERDKAYHQGTVWSYLSGPFLTSFLKVHNHSIDAQLRVSQMIEPFKNHLESDGCIGTISEIFDGDSPHESKGCFAQAWSVAELIRCYIEDIKGQKPTLMV